VPDDERSTVSGSASTITPAPSTTARDWVWITRQPFVGPLAALVVAVVAFSALTPTFLTPYNLSLIGQQSIVVGILAVAQTIVILTAGIDLSIGAIAVLGTIIMAKNVADAGPAGALLLALLVCVVIGAINGSLVAYVQLPPFIVTLGTYTAVAAATQLYAGSATYPVTSKALTVLGHAFGMGSLRTTLGVGVLVVTYLVCLYVLGQTAAGRHVYAVGGNPTAARFSGIKTNRTLMAVYVMTGVIAGIAAWAALGRIPNADPNAYQTANLDTITAVVIGGTSLFGGRGSVMGTLIGTLIVGVLRNGLTLVGVDNLYQNIATGVLVILAVAFDQVARRRLQ
jgi:fructose transport system permease protein